jgi:hypothetical protein
MAAAKECSATYHYPIVPPSLARKNRPLSDTESERRHYARTAFERRRSCDLSGQTVWVITAEDLILAKLNWARDSHSEFQLNDVRAMLRGEDLDRFYIEKWVHDLALHSIWEMVKP